MRLIQDGNVSRGRKIGTSVRQKYIVNIRMKDFYKLEKK